MKRMPFSRLTGVIYVVASVFGLLISLGGLIILWSTKADVTQRVTGTVTLVGRTLTATHETIAVLGRSLDQAATDLQMLDKMVNDVAGSMSDTEGMVRSTGSLVGGDLTNFVSNTQTSLTSLESTAKVVDNVLRTITGIPLIGPWLGGQKYNPEVPLDESVRRVSASMNTLPDSLKKINRDLDVAATNIDTVNTELQVLGKQVKSIEESISEAQQQVVEYRSILTTVQARYVRFEQRLPVILNTIYITLTLILVWIFMTQIGMLLHGISMMG